MHSLSVDFYVLDIGPYELEMFELLVDGRPMADWLADGNGGIPLWLVEDGLPRWRGREPDSDPSLYIVTVCDCGESGCGHSRCHIHHTGETVVFEDFQGNAASTSRHLRLEFPAKEFEAVLERIRTAKA